MKEFKERYIAAHWGQEVGVVDRTNVRNHGYVIEGNINQFSYIELTPLSSITDEHAIEVAAIMHSESSMMDTIKNILLKEQSDNRPFDLDKIERVKYDSYEGTDYYYTSINTIGKVVSNVCIYDDGDIKIYDEKGNDYQFENGSSVLFLAAYDFLRSKGYALPYGGKSVLELIEQKLLKLKG